MAKKPKNDGQNVIAFSVNTLGQPEKTALATLKKPILAAAAQWGQWDQKVRDLAPKVMRLFRSIQHYYDQVPGAKTFRFIDFVRMIDPSTPKEAADYRKHRTYYTIRNMQTLDNAANRDTTAGQAQGGPIRDRAVNVLARALRFIEENIPGVNGREMIDAVIKTNGLSKNVRTRLEKKIASLPPLWRMTVTSGHMPKAVKLDIIPLSDAEIKATEAAEPMAQGGRSIHVPAEVQEQAAALGRSLGHKLAGRRKAS